MSCAFRRAPFERAGCPPLRRTFLVVFVACRRFLKDAAHWGVSGDASCGDYTDDVGEELVAV